MFDKDIPYNREVMVLLIFFFFLLCAMVMVAKKQIGWIDKFNAGMEWNGWFHLIPC
jgi:hypothetical protein